jgi:hypothetical protein
MTFSDLPPWTRVWVIVTIAALTLGPAACIALGIVLELDQLNQSFSPHDAAWSGTLTLRP